MGLEINFVMFTYSAFYLSLFSVPLSSRTIHYLTTLERECCIISEAGWVQPVLYILYLSISFSAFCDYYK